MNEVVFEQYGFTSYCRVPGPPLSLLAYKKENPDFAPLGVGLVLDTGYSCTYTTAVLDNRIAMNTVRRIDIGGKLLTNYLKVC